MTPKSGKRDLNGEAGLLLGLLAIYPTYRTLFVLDKIYTLAFYCRENGKSFFSGIFWEAASDGGYFEGLGYQPPYYVGILNILSMLPVFIAWCILAFLFVGLVGLSAHLASWGARKLLGMPNRKGIGSDGFTAPPTRRSFRRLRRREKALRVAARPGTPSERIEKDGRKKYGACPDKGT